MNCPRCGVSIQFSYEDRAAVCDNCGWGRNRPESPGPSAAETAPAAGVVLTLLLAVSAVFLAGPWVAIFRYQVIEPGDYWRLYYFGAVLFYLLLANTFSPSIDTGRHNRFDMFFPGRYGRIHRQYALFVALMALALIPGKIVNYTLWSCWRLARRG